MKTGNRDGDALHSDEALMNALAALNTVLQFEQHADIGGLGNEGDNCGECIQNEREKPHGQLTPEFRAEALFRLFQGLGVASRNNGTPLGACWVPVEAIDQQTGEILESKNDYQQVRIGGRSYPAHVAVMILVNDRVPIRGRGPELDEVGMHLCNNPACRNPFHLKLGTCQQDSDFKVRCGRAPSGPTSGHSTKPEATPKEESHYRTRLKGKQRIEALELLKKYADHRGSVPKIADKMGVDRGVIDYMKRKRLHLAPDIRESDIELTFTAWTKGRKKVKYDHPKRCAVAKEIRERFHRAQPLERTGLLLQMPTEYDYSQRWIRKILNRDVYPEVAPEIPIPDNFGIGRRNRKKKTNLSTPNE